MTDDRPRFFSSGPSFPEPRGPVAEEIDRLADRLGFANREPPGTLISKRIKLTEETVSFTARLSLKSANAFIEWTKRERVSYREGFDHLMRLLENEGKR